jgi:hypothetical protein
MLAELDQTGESQISLTDPDSRAMAAHTILFLRDDSSIFVKEVRRLLGVNRVDSRLF